MTKINEIELIKEEMATVKKIFLGVVDEIPSFDITDTKILPYGLRAHTRSISWIVEQVITQQAKYRAKRLGIDDVDINLPDTCLHDCVIHKNTKRYFVNVKIHNKVKNTISSVAS
ncbi:MAG: hypothetical protein CVV39_02955 [Planctomycetes bacterium HGW-Planctomycetes-1]|nr:MAG: hypothetical protein CVV39_02955 [Planctomycetes bacterium HGW-Planctomycetes-1]